MTFVWYLLIALVSGVLAGMGMGGGTLLIPMLTILMGVEQTVAQSVNLLVFVPCGLICFIIYAKDNLVDFKGGGIIAFVATILSVIASLIAVKISPKWLRMSFGIFIAGLGLVQIIVFVVKKIKEKNV